MTYSTERWLGEERSTDFPQTPWFSLLEDKEAFSVPEQSSV